jgi:Uma2 family endonuclease
MVELYFHIRRNNRMATGPQRPRVRKIDYPTGDGKPMAETDIHLDNMIDVLRTLQDWFAAEPMVYVSGDLLMYYEEGNPRRVVAPDIFVVRGIEKKLRDNYLIWAEGKAPDVVIEITSKYRKREDRKEKVPLYRDVLRLPEYFVFDPTEDYLVPPLQGFRLVEGEHVSIESLDGRLPSEVLGLHLEQDGRELQFCDPVRRSRVSNPSERIRVAKHAAESARKQTEAQAFLRGLIEENAQLRHEIEALRRRLSSGQ